ncbi:hypothetical protein D187_005292 [Cystobacter fuscus DSM 2262]|uniref:Uncharacterized protein n=1 Tax=Cystobacter fuscus (strain ATCC 25194 / DSM 2262 / NBRC 100088 / M29) TaxID=1242864 RepID=S9R5D4_CYSF2|nr:hypothetical protein D187_005292 [Cystobacter fuscus DSM 2262]
MPTCADFSRQHSILKMYNPDNLETHAVGKDSTWAGVRSSASS